MRNYKNKELWKKNLSISHQGMIFSKTHCENISKSKIGKKDSNQTKLIKSLASKGKPKSKQHAINIGLGHKGIKPSEASKRKMSISHLGQPAYWKGKKLPEYVKVKIRIARMKQVFPLKDTKPEKIMQFNLSVMNIVYRKHVTIIGQPDIFIEPNFCIFIDGDYWHSIPKVRGRDTYINKELRKRGYQVIRIPEFAIKKYPNHVTEYLIGRIYS